MSRPVCCRVRAPNCLAKDSPSDSTTSRAARATLRKDQIWTWLAEPSPLQDQDAIELANTPLARWSLGGREVRNRRTRSHPTPEDPEGEQHREHRIAQGGGLQDQPRQGNHQSQQESWQPWRRTSNYEGDAETTPPWSTEVRARSRSSPAGTARCSCRSRRSGQSAADAPSATNTPKIRTTTMFAIVRLNSFDPVKVAASPRWNSSTRSTGLSPAMSAPSLSTCKQVAAWCSSSGRGVQRGVVDRRARGRPPPRTAHVPPV